MMSAGVSSAQTVQRVTCGPGDHPETALQGQVPAYMRATGFQGFNCNLQLIGQSKGDGANWQTTQFKDRAGHVCAYHGTSFSTTGRTHLGVPTVDITDPTHPTPTAYLTTTSMLDPWESLKVNERRQLLAADNGHNGGGGPEVDIYDLSLDCRTPQLLGSVAVGSGSDGSDVVTPIVGHEGAWAPDGLTYYGGDLRFRPAGAAATTGQYYAVDTADPMRPKLITTWLTNVAGANVHGMAISEDGNRLLRFACEQRWAGRADESRGRGEQRPADLRPEPDPGARAQCATAAHQLAHVERRVDGAAHHPGEDRGSSVRDLRRRGRLLWHGKHRAIRCGMRRGHDAIPARSCHRHRR